MNDATYNFKKAAQKAHDRLTTARGKLPALAHDPVLNKDLLIQAQADIHAAEQAYIQAQIAVHEAEIAELAAQLEGE